MTGLENIRNTLARLSQEDGLMEMLMEFERTLDGVELYVYKNWIKGELVSGPHVNKYWFNTVWLYPATLMPDPEGALRLEKIGCKVFFKKDILNQPVRIRSPADWEDSSDKKARLEEIPVWLVHINMPMHFITDTLDAYQSYIEDNIEKETEDISDNIMPEDMGGEDLGGEELGGELGGGDELEI